MKKAICLLIAASLCLVFLISCGETETKHEISDYDSVSRITAEENDASGNRTDEVSQAPAEGEIVIKDKKYVFEGTDLVILEVDNKTNRDYSITINGTYLDENGKTVGELNALNTIGSIIGTFTPTFITIPLVGTAWTFIIFAIILLAISLCVSEHISIIPRRARASSNMFMACPPRTV